MAVEFSAVALPISAPGSDITLKALEALDARALAVQKRFEQLMGNLKEKSEKAIPPVDRLAASLRRMQEAAAQKQANVMTELIKSADPFQRAAREAEVFTQATTRAHMSTGRLSQELMTVTRNLLGLNPAVAQLGGMLGNMTLGSATMIGILGGIAALGFAWEKLTEKTRKAHEESKKAVEYLEGLGHDQKYGEFGSTPEAIVTLGLELNAIRAKIKLQEGYVAAASYITRGGLQKELDDLRKQEQEKIRLIQYGVNEQLRIEREGAERRRQSQRLLDDYTAEQIDKKTQLGGLATGLLESSLRGSALERIRAMVIPESVIKAVTAAKFTDPISMKRAKEYADEMVNLSRDMASRITSVIGDTLSAGLSGGIGAAFVALGKGILKGLGEMFVQVGEKGLAGAILMKLLKDSFSFANPEMGIKAALGLITLGSAMIAAGSSHGGGGGGGRGGGGYSSGFGGANYGAVAVAPSASYAPNMSGVKAQAPVIVQATFFGKYDARAGRELLEMIDYHQGRKI